MAAADNTPGTLLGLTIPSTINVSNGTYANFTASASDAGLGIDYVYVSLDKSFQNSYGRQSALYFYNSTDSFSDLSSTLNQYFSSATSSGAYNIEYVYVWDKAGNYNYYSSSQLKSMGINTSFTVSGGAATDNTPGTLLGLTIPSTINVSNGTYVNFTASASDAGSGIDYVYVSLDKSFQNSYGRQSALYFYNSTDSFSDLSSTLNQYFSSATSSGAYNIEYVYVWDKAGNYNYYSSSQLKSMGINTSFTVSGGAATDNTPGTLLGLTIPSTINVSNGTYVNFTASASDAGSGIDYVYVSLDKSFQNSYGRQSALYFYNSTDSFSDLSSTLNQYFS
ncbi:hypothetical protein EOE18_04160 [Novosphingobium umbonatum]|uniref:Uncharacterized protein n=1 Tax=Novosphingobium umbonatum TaxID=1908524 RepID=A0A437NB63_9SPHN|nr:hypothetical protein [Novosphingobium umbonatum]RVU07145.1 hypothetical protein EOE18_04160 [Novosphingobium umbonatum]